MDQKELSAGVGRGDIRFLSRAVSLIENRAAGYELILAGLNFNAIPVIGITGPPGAGKSSLTDALIAEYVKRDQKVAVLCIDPSSAFTRGALLGDRIRMNRWYNEERVFIRSLSSRGALGGLNPMIVEITDLLSAAPFDVIIIETVGVGQSEIAIHEIADVTVVVMVPEAGDDVQVMKSGLMEIADLFVVNKADRPGADIFIKNLKDLMHSFHPAQVIKTVAIKHEGIEELFNAVNDFKSAGEPHGNILLNKAMALIRQERMKDIDEEKLDGQLREASAKPGFNLYRFVKDNFNQP